MAKGKKTGGRDFKPGNNANPLGAPKVPEDLREARKITRTEFARILNKLVLMNRDEIRESNKRQDAPILELLVASVINKGLVFGDHNRVGFLLDRLIGKVKDEIEVSGNLTFTELVKKWENESKKGSDGST